MASGSAGREFEATEPNWDNPSIDDLFGVAYAELKRLAQAVRRSDPNATLSPTTLVNEAYLKLSVHGGAQFQSRLHFSRVAARAMRQILVEAARRRCAAKRGGGNQKAVSIDEGWQEVASTHTDILALHDALGDLEKLNPRQATVVETRFFGGFNDRQIAEYLNVSEATVLRDWRVAKAFLFEQMHRES